MRFFTMVGMGSLLSRFFQIYGGIESDTQCYPRTHHSFIKNKNRMIIMQLCLIIFDKYGSMVRN